MFYASSLGCWGLFECFTLCQYNYVSNKVQCHAKMSELFVNILMVLLFETNYIILVEIDITEQKYDQQSFINWKFNFSSSSL